MSLYQCNDCNKYYLHTQECGEYLTKEADEKDVSKAILVCQCGRKHLIGLEPYDDGYCYFGEDIRHIDGEDLEKLKEFPVIMLKEKDKKNYICSTYTYNYLDMKGRTVYLDIDENYLGKDENYEKIRKMYNMIK